MHGVVCWIGCNSKLWERIWQKSQSGLTSPVAPGLAVAGVLPSSAKRGQIIHEVEFNQQSIHEVKFNKQFHKLLFNKHRLPSFWKILLKSYVLNPISKRIWNQCEVHNAKHTRIFLHRGIFLPFLWFFLYYYYIVLLLGMYRDRIRFHICCHSGKFSRSSTRVFC